MGAVQQEDLKVRRLTIVDEAGDPRIEMKTDDAGNPSIILVDKDGVKRIRLENQAGHSGQALSSRKTGGFAESSDSRGLLPMNVQVLESEEQGEIVWSA